MGQSLQKLIETGGAALCSEDPALDIAALAVLGKPANQLTELLSRKNGFYAFESALHVYSTRAQDAEIGLREWNSPDLWIAEYRGLADGYLFFAEDIFGCQFCVGDAGFHQFDPETGQTQKIAVTLEGWADAVLGNYRLLTGYPLAHEWQRANGAIPPGYRLIPKVPFVAGGPFDMTNLYQAKAVNGMKFRASLALQIKDLPDGAKIRFEIGP